VNVSLEGDLPQVSDLSGVWQDQLMPVAGLTAHWDQHDHRCTAPGGIQCFAHPRFQAVPRWVAPYYFLTPILRQSIIVDCVVACAFGIGSVRHDVDGEMEFIVPLLE
jgi:hypothetical protein